ncbi:MAG: glycosyltransferase [Bowdeniella nasicola]|nr:glycosyltransferase [Bowdeniella nasicola]
MKERQHAGVTLVTRIHAPEPAAASLRLAAVEDELLKRHVRVAVLTSTPPPGIADAIDPPGLRVSRWPAWRDSEGQLRGYLPYLSFDLPLVMRVLAQRSPSVFLVEPPPTTGAVMRVMASLLKRPYVWYAADIWSDALAGTRTPRYVRHAVRWLESWVLRGASHVIAVSPEVAERARTLGARAVTVVRNGVNTELFHPDVAPLSANERSIEGVGEGYFIYAGTASEWQGAEIFVEAIRRARRAGKAYQMVFLGQGSALADLEARAREIPALPSGNPSVVFLGQRPAAEAARWQAGALGSLVSIKPGLGYDFAYPTKVLSALSCGVPVIYAGLGPVRKDLDDPQLGLAVDYDVAAVERALNTVASTEADSRRVAYRHAWVRKHRSTRSVGKIVAQILHETARGTQL